MTTNLFPVRRLVDVAHKIQDGTHFSPRLGGGSFKYITSRNIGFGKLRLDSVDTISFEEHAKIYRRADTRLGDILLTKDGANTGNAALNAFNEEISLLSSVAFIRANPKLSVEPFILQYLLSGHGQRQMTDAMAGNAITRLTLTKIKDLIVPAPDVDEQRRIGTVLADVDSLAFSLERLIAKKRAIKQGMMQELLTGRTRLPGFSGEWSKRTIGEIANVVMGQSPSGKSYNARGIGTPLIQGNADIRDRRTVDRVWTTEPTKRVRSGEVVLTVRAPVGYTAIAIKDACLGRGVCGISAGKSTPFLFHALVAAEPTWALLEQGSTFTSVNSVQVRAFELDWPQDVDEGAAIAKVLGDADAEIEVLERRLESTCAVKQGMMQELLTGRTRLPVVEEVSV